MATSDGVSLTVPLRLIGPPLFAEATACVGGKLFVSSIVLPRLKKQTDKTQKCFWIDKNSSNE